MKNRNIIVLVVVLFVAVLVGWWLWTHHEPEEVSAPVTAAAGQSTNSPDVATSEPSFLPSAQAISEVTRNLTGERERQREQAAERSLNEWRTPIEFYGKVVDETGQPVAGVAVSFSCNDLSTAGTSFYQTTSDAQGLFSITGIKGKLLTVELSKPGYYTSQRDTRHFYFAGQNVNFVPKAGQPVLFHLRQHGQAEPLILFENDFLIARDGTPVEVNLATGRPVPVGQGDLRIECWTEDQGVARGQKYDWRCRVSVPGGGLQVTDEEFPFEAPAEGYVDYDLIDMTVATAERWQRNAERKYFLKLGNRNYARITFKMIAGGGHFFYIQSSLNPAGSRNLEYSDAAQAEPTTR